MVSKAVGACMIAVLSFSFAHAQTVEQDVEKLKQEVEQLKKQLADLTSNVSETLVKVQQNKEAIDALSEQISEQLTLQDQLLRAIADYDSAGKPMLRLRSMMDNSASFKDEVRDAVNSSMATHGRFTVTNKTANYERIQVNRVEYGLSPGQAVTLEVPVGTVTTQQPGQELKNWTLSAPAYEEAVDIVPTTTAAYPPAPVYASPPVIYSYSAPIWLGPGF